jgi:hypothetical protein
MNRLYKVIWNASRHIWTVVGELSKAHGIMPNQHLPAGKYAKIIIYNYMGLSS